MKKIVALVLSLVMVLGLASVAFAATPAYYTGDKTDLKLSVSTANVEKYSYTLEAYTPGNATAKTFDTLAIWATDKLSGAKTLVFADKSFVVTPSAESADIAFVDGTTVTYLAFATTYTGTVTALPTVDEEDAEKCGDMFVGGDFAAYTDVNGKLYVEKANGTVYNVGGKYVELAEVTVAGGTLVVDKTAKDLPLTTTDYTLYVVAHNYDMDYKTYGSDKTVTRVFCTECKGEFAFVEGTVADAVAKFGAGNYNDLGNGLFIAKVAGTAPVAPEAGDKVESAETFDAGIAMYVGMSVMAAAGSAVVLKKKD